MEDTEIPTKFWSEKNGGKDHDLFWWIIDQQDGRVWSRNLGSGQGSVAEFCKHGNGPFSSTYGGKFLRQLSDYWLLTKNTAQWTLVQYTTYCCGKCNFINPK